MSRSGHSRNVGANQTSWIVLAKVPTHRAQPTKGSPMLNGLFQWERFVTPSIVKPFFWLAIGIAVLLGLSGIASALQMMAASPGLGITMLLASLLGMVAGILFTRIAAEFVLIVFRINEHLGAIRNRGEM